MTNANWSEYDSFKEQNDFIRQYYVTVNRCQANALGDMLPGDRVAQALDIACGYGDSTRVVAKFAKSVVGVDNSETLIAKARQADFDADVQFTCSSFEDYSHSGQLFDLVCGAWFLNHVHGESDLLAVIDKVRGLLSEDGSICFVVPSDSFTSRRIQTIGQSIGWVQGWTREEMEYTQGVFCYGDEWIPTTVWQPLYLMRLLQKWFDVRTFDVKGVLAREQLLPELNAEPPFEVIYGRLQKKSEPR